MKNIIEVVKENKSVIAKGLLAVCGVVGAFTLGKALMTNDTEEEDVEENDNVVNVNFEEEEVEE